MHPSPHPLSYTNTQSYQQHDERQAIQCIGMSDQMSVVTLIRMKVVFQVKLQVKVSVHSGLT